MLTDKSRSEHFKRLFKAHLKVAQSVTFVDNFKSVYDFVLNYVELQPEVEPGFRCGLCMEDFISMEDHVQLVFDPYVQFVMGKMVTVPPKCKDVWQYLGKILPGIKELLAPVQLEWVTGDWGDNDKIRGYIEEWTSLFEKTKAKVDEFQLEKNLKSILSSAEHLEKTKRLIITLAKLKDRSPAEIIKAMKTAGHLNLDQGPTQLSKVDFILPAYLKFAKDFTDWLKLSQTMAEVTPRLAVVLGKMDFLCGSGEDCFLKLGLLLAKVKGEEPNGLAYAHLCFLLGSCDMEQVAKAIGCSKNSSEEVRRMATHYLLKFGNVQAITQIGQSFVSKGDRETGTMFLLPLVKHQLEKGEFDKGLQALDLVLPQRKVWNCVSLLLRKYPGLLLESKVIAEKVLDMIQNRFEEALMFECLMFMGIGRDITQAEVSTATERILAVAGALHIAHKEYTNPKLLQSLGMYLHVGLNQGKSELFLAALRVPGITPLLKELLDSKMALNAGDHDGIFFPGSTYQTSLLYLRGLYNYKNGSLLDTCEDLISCCLNTTSDKCPLSVGAFLGSNPMIHEKLLQSSNGDFRRLLKFIEQYSGKETLNTSQFPQILQQTVASLTPKLSLVFTISSTNARGVKLPDVSYLERDILGRQEVGAEDDADYRPGRCRQDNVTVQAAWTPKENADRGYEYVDLEVICYAREETISCITMAAYFFLQAMLSTPETSIPEKFAYRGLILECMNQLSIHCNFFTVAPVIALYALRSIQGFILKANQHFSSLLSKTKSKANPASSQAPWDPLPKMPFIDDDSVAEIVRDWQSLLNLRLLCPLMTPEIFMIAEGKIALHSLQVMDRSLLLRKVESGRFSANVKEHLCKHYLFNGVWMERIKPEEAGRENEKDAPGPNGRGHPDGSQRRRTKKKGADKEKGKDEVAPVTLSESFKVCKENSMESLGKLFGFDLNLVEDIMRWQCIRRTPDGFIDVKNRSLNFAGQGQAFSKFVGVRVDPVTKLCHFLLEPADNNSNPPLFTLIDLFEIFGFQIENALVSFEEELYSDDAGKDKDLQDHERLPIPFNPFYKVHFYGTGPPGYASKELVCGTNFLMTLYHLDLLLKALVTGQEISANFPFYQRSTKDHLLANLSSKLQTILKPLAERKKVTDVKPMELAMKVWLDIDEVQHDVECGPDSQGFNLVFRFDKVKMSLKSRSMDNDFFLDAIESMNLDEIGSNVDTEFCREFNSNLASLETIFPIIGRVRELAKISAAFSILHRNRDIFHEGMGVFEEFERKHRPFSRIYSKCKWSGLKSKACRCPAWVPAAFGVAKVTPEQKLQHISGLKKGGPAKLTYSVPDDLEAGSSTSTRLVKGKKKKKDPSTSTTNLGAVDLIEQYKVYGGIRFHANVVPSNPPLPKFTGAVVRVSFGEVIDKFGAWKPKLPANTRVPLPPAPQTLGTGSAVGEGHGGGKKSKKNKNTSRDNRKFPGDARVYAITKKDGGREEDLLQQGQFGVAMVPGQGQFNEGSFIRARNQTRNVATEAVRRGEETRFELVVFENELQPKT